MNELKQRLQDTMDADQYQRAFGNLKQRGKKSPANSLTQSVIDYIHLKGGVARRVNTQGQYVDAKFNERGVQLKGTGQWRTGGMRKGFEDVSCIIPPHGKYLAVEIKIKLDKLSPEQVERKQEVERVGGIYYEAKNFDDFKIFYDKLI